MFRSFEMKRIHQDAGPDNAIGIFYARTTVQHRQMKFLRSQNCVVAFDLSFSLDQESLTPLEQPDIQKQDLDVHEAIESRVFTITSLHH